jgi:hypothetical protein
MNIKIKSLKKLKSPKAKEEALKKQISTWEKEVYQDWYDNQFNFSIQTIFTPFKQVLEILDKVRTLDNKDVCVIANSEIYLLLKGLKSIGQEDFQYKSLSFITDIKSLKGKDNIKVVDFSNIDKIKLDMKFDVELFNPPYGDKTGSAQSTTIWHKFVGKALDLLKPNGILCTIHPSGYRKDASTFRKLFNRMKQYQFEFISLSNYKTGLDIFKENTTCDWYVIKNVEKFKNTVVRGVDGKTIEIDMSKVIALPDSNLDKLNKIADYTKQNSVEILKDTTYHTQRDYISKVKDKTFTHPVVYTLKKDGPTFKYSSRTDLGSFTKPKVILGKGKGMPVLDLEGKIGYCEFSYGITGEKEYLKKVYKALQTPECIQDLNELGSGDGHNYIRSAVELLRKDFWKNYITE